MPRKRRARLTASEAKGDFLTRAEELWDRFDAWYEANPEATFDEMAKEKSVEDDAAQGGRLGPVPEGAFESVNPELEEAVFKTLQLKEISQPIKVELTRPRQPGEEEEEDEEEAETRWTLVEVLTRTQRIPATWEKSWFAVMQQAIYRPQYYEKISHRALSDLAAISDEDFQAGLCRMAESIPRQNDDSAVYEPIDLFTFTKT